jgi:putative thioredoxin
MTMDELISGAGNSAEPARGATGLVKDVTMATFRADVLDASKDALVLIDFWADWCGPCKQLTPTLEKIVPSYKGRVRLAKVNVDKEQMLAGQFGIQSLPTVMAVINGRPVNAFQGALPETQLRAFVDKCLAAMGPAPEAPDIEDALAQAQMLAEAGDVENAANVYMAILEVEPGHVAATVGLAKMKLAVQDFEAAESLLATLDAAKAKTPEITQMLAGISLSRDFTPLPNRAEVAARANADANDHEAQYSLATDAIARGDMEIAAAYLLHSIGRKRDWNEGAARQLLVRLFDAMGQDSDFTTTFRRKLSAILFS